MTIKIDKTQLSFSLVNHINENATSNNPNFKICILNLEGRKKKEE